MGTVAVLLEARAVSRPDPVELAAGVVCAGALALLMLAVYDLLDSVGAWAQYLALAAILGVVAFLLVGYAASRPPRD